MDEDLEATGRAKGGVARAQSLDSERRSEIASRAAKARWGARKDGHLPIAEYGSPDRPLRLLDAEIPCYVLSDGTRVLTQQGFLLALGRARTAKGGTGASGGVDNTPAFLAANNLKPLISQELIASTRPIEFRLPTGGKAFGFAAEALPKVCNVYLKARDQNILTPAQRRIAQQADMLVRGLAETGIVALVDEATGYQAVRARDALQAFLERFLRKELAAWVKTFPEEFFSEMYRLKGWPWKGNSRRPGVVGHYINDLIYDRLGPGVLEQLQRLNPSDGHGRRKSKHTQWLTEDIGHPALAQHMYATIGAMRAHSDWKSFLAFFKRAYPKKGENLALALDDPNKR
jgi:P63C domain